MAPGESSSRPTLHLHIGSPKTGTSAIQAFLTLNRDAFRQATGVHYPPAANDRLVLNGIPTAGNGARIARLLRSRRAEFLAQAVAFTERELVRGGPQVLFSSEGFWSVPDDAMAAFVEALEDRAEVRFLFYARPQVDHVQSAYLQILGAQRFQGDVAAYFDALGYKFFVGSKLEMLSRLVGHDRVGVRKYDRGSLIGGDVVDDFAERFGLAVAAPFRRPAEVNDSLDAEHYLYARAVSASPALAGKAKQLMHDLRQDPVLSELYAQAGAITGLEVMDLATARRIRDAYRTDNELLDRLAPDAGLDFNAENDRAVEALEAAAAGEVRGLSRLGIVLLSRLAELEIHVAELRAKRDGEDANDPDGDGD